MPGPQPISPKPTSAAGVQLLDTWKEIAVYLNRDLRTVKRWEQSRGLPVHRLPGGPQAAVYALKSELDAWRRGDGQNVEKTDTVGSPRNASLIRWSAALAASLAIAGLIVWRLWSRFPGVENMRITMTST